jgi:hypothetical protein
MNIRLSRSPLLHRSSHKALSLSNVFTVKWKSPSKVHIMVLYVWHRVISLKMKAEYLSESSLTKPYNIDPTIHRKDLWFLSTKEITLLFSSLHSSPVLHHLSPHTDSSLSWRGRDGAVGRQVLRKNGFQGPPLLHHHHYPGGHCGHLHGARHPSRWSEH